MCITFGQAAVLLLVSFVELAEDLRHVLESIRDGLTGVPGTGPDPQTQAALLQ